MSRRVRLAETRSMKRFRECLDEGGQAPEEFSKALRAALLQAQERRSGGCSKREPIPCGRTERLLRHPGTRIDYRCHRLLVTALMSAVRLGKVEVARRLLEAGADADVRDAEGRAACHFAAAEGRREALEMLAAAGAELAVPDRAGRLLLHIVAGSPAAIQSPARLVALP